LIGVNLMADARGVQKPSVGSGEGDVRFKAVVPALLILLTVNFNAWARKDSSRPFFLRSDAVMNGVEIPAGIYELSWEAHNSTVRVTLRKDGKFFATAQGAWVKNAAKYPEDAVLLRLNSDGTRSLIEIRVAGTNRSIVLNHAAYTVRVTENRP
jgi:hypothetical protein